MIGTLLKVSWINLKRDRGALVMTFALPLAFFSIFAVIFGGQGRGSTPRVSIALVDEDHSEASRRIVEALLEEPGLKVQRETPGMPPRALERAAATALVRDGKLPLAVIVPSGFGAAFGLITASGKPVEMPIELIADESNPIAPQMVGGLLQKAAMSAAPDLMMRRGLEMLERFGGGLTEQQKAAVDRWLPLRRAQSAASRPRASSSRASDPSFGGPVAVKIEPLHAADGERSPLLAFYAAGTGVMFMLFSMAGAAGTLLEEQESGTLERLLNCRLGIRDLLLGKGMFIAAIGALQVTVMFVWGWLVFGIDLWKPSHLAGFMVMTPVTAAAAAGFGLLLATACKTRNQLAGLSTIVILVMSAIGGSMFPRFLMPETLQKVALVTFNAWALDGYQKVFWYDKPPLELWPQVAVLASLAVVFLLVARRLGRRWESA